MNLMEILKAAAAKSAEGGQKFDSDLNSSVAQTVDRMKMLNPNVQGPKLPDETEQEKDYYEGLPSAVSGSVQAGFPGLSKVLGRAAGAAESGIAKGAGETMKDLGMDTQKIARAADFADRLKEQARAMKLSRLRKMTE